MTFPIYSHRNSELYPFAGYSPIQKQPVNYLSMNNIISYSNSFSKTDFSTFQTYLKGVKKVKPTENDVLDPSATIMHIDRVNMLSPLPVNYISDHSSGKKIYSFFSKSFYENFDQFIVFNEDVFDIAMSTTVANAFKTKKHLKTILEIDADHGSIEENFISSKADIFSTLFTILINSDVEIPTFDTIKIIDTKGTCSGSTFEFSLKNVSYNKVMKKSGGFLPVLVPFSFAHLKSSSFVENAYLFTFMYNIDYKKISKYKKASSYLSTFLKQAFLSGGSYFYNQDLYNYYGTKKISSYDGLTEIQYKNARTTKTLHIFDKYKKYQYFSQPANLFKDYSLPSDFLSKKRKFVDKKKQARSFLNNEFKDNLHNFITFKDSYNGALSRLKRYESLLNEAKNEILTRKKELEDIKRKIPGIFDTYTLNYRLSFKLDEKINQIHEEEGKILETLEPRIDPYYENIFNSIELRRIELTDSKNNTTSYIPDKDFTLTSFTKRFLTDKKIDRIVFATKLPSKISVVQNSDSVVGGPYIIDVSKNSLKIALKDLTSYYAVTNVNHARILIHPHASSIPFFDTSSTENIKPYFSSACLGEASSLLYKAFDNKDIKLIITSALLWVQSANSTDVWGKNYKYFTPWEEYERQNEFLNTPFKVNATFEKYISNPESSYKNFVNSLPLIKEVEEAANEDVVSQPNPEPEPLVSQQLEEQLVPPETNTSYIPLINLN